MKQCVVFSTPGLIPLEAFTMFGVNSKPNTTNPIGFFGTGLKYAIAVCLRMNQKVVLWRGLDKYTFYVKDTDFRGKEFAFIRMKLEKWQPLQRLLGRPSYTSLPFTTELGKHWELWQAYRELEANTRDENGKTQLWKDDQYNGFESCGPKDNEHTSIAVYGDKFVDEYYDRGKIFLEDGLTERQGPEGIQVLDRPSRYIYFRGMRVMDLKEESRYTYNFLKAIDLTEDRTAKYPFLIQGDIADLIKSSEDENFIRETVPLSTYSGSSYFEHTIPYTYAYATPSRPFLNRARSAKRAEVKELWEQSQPLVPTHVILQLTIPKPEVTQNEMTKILGAATDILGPMTIKNMMTNESIQSDQPLSGPIHTCEDFQVQEEAGVGGNPTEDEFSNDIPF